MSTLAGLAGPALAGVDAGRTSAPVVKNVNGWITALAMDGSRVAYGTQAFAPTNCDKLFVWNVLTRSAVLVSGPKTGRCGSDDPHAQLIREAAIAGARVAWIRNITGNTENDDSLSRRRCRSHASGLSHPRCVAATLPPERWTATGSAGSSAREASSRSTRGPRVRPAW
jgi:hypothetical protein